MALGHNMTLATKTHNRRRVAVGGGHDLYDALMAELSRVGIAQRIRQARKERGLHQHEMADALHVHKNTVSNWESQSKPITAWDRLEEISKLLGVSHSWLIHGDPEPDENPEPRLRGQFSDALRALQEGQDHLGDLVQDSQENVLARLGELAVSVSRLEALLTTLTGQAPSQGTSGSGRSD